MKSNATRKGTITHPKCSPGIEFSRPRIVLSSFMHRCPDPLQRQIGGSHYKDYPIQPIEFMVKNKLSFIVGNVIKYLCRYNRQGGKGLQDLEKCIHYIELLIEIEGWRKK